MYNENMKIVIGIFYGLSGLLILCLIFSNCIENFFGSRKLKKRFGCHFYDTCKKNSYFPLLYSENAKAWDYELAENEKFLNGITLLHVVAALGNQTGVSYCLMRFPDSINAQDDNGLTPLDYAKKFNETEVIKLLENYSKK